MQSVHISLLKELLSVLVAGCYKHLTPNGVKALEFENHSRDARATTNLVEVNGFHEAVNIQYRFRDTASSRCSVVRAATAAFGQGTSPGVGG